MGRSKYFLLVCLLLTACGSDSGSSPQEFKDATINSSSLPQELKDTAINKISTLLQSSLSEQKDFEVTCSEKLELTNADSANEISEKWCVRVDFLEKSNISGEIKWRDRSNVDAYAFQNGVWISQMYPACGCR